MTGGHRMRTSSLFLMELMLAILFFSITSAVCLQFFVKSHRMGQQSKELTQAVNLCSAVAEICKTSNGISGAGRTLAELYPESKIAGSGSMREICIYYDEDFQVCGSQEGAYELRTSLCEKGNDLCAEIAMKEREAKPASQIYSLDIVHHIARRTAYE